MRTWHDRFLVLLLGAFLLGCPSISASQEVKPKGEKTGAVVTARPVTASIDPRFRSPRATVRTFLIAMNLTEDDPHRIEEAIACLDLSEMPADQRNGGRLAFELEFILRSTNIPTYVIPDDADDADCEIGEGKDIKLRLHRLPDGRWLFEGKTLEKLPKMRLVLWERTLAASQGKEPGDVPPVPNSDHLMRLFEHTSNR